MAKLYDLARVVVKSAPGTGPIALGPAVFGYLTFSAAGVQDQDVITYAINDYQQSEIGHGTYTAATNTLVRTTILSSTNGGIGGSAISASATAQVFITIAAEDIVVAGSNITIGTTAVIGGTPGTLLYNNAGVVGQLPQNTFVLPVGNNTLTGNNTFSGANTFSGNNTFTGNNDYGAVSSITLPTGNVTNANLALVPALTIKGNNSGSSSSPADLTVSQVTSMLQSTFDLRYATLSANNTWTGNNFFKSGAPWADVKAFGAVGNGSTDDTTAIQNAINFMFTNYTGGVVFFPPGTYRTASGVIIKGGVRLVGAGRVTTTISAFSDNVATAAVTFGSTCTQGCSIENMTVLGYFSTTIASITGYAISVTSNIRATMEHVTAWYGLAGMYTAGIDGIYLDVWFNGCQDSVISQGASFYTRCDFDSNGSFASQRFGFFQTTSSGTLENGFSQCDFSGNFTNSVNIAGSGTLSKFTECIFSASVSIVTSRWCGFNNCEIGNTIVLNGSTGGFVSVVGSYAFSPITLSGNFSKAGNTNIS